jgi:hypothetical protein
MNDLDCFFVASRFPPLLSSVIVGGCLIGSLVLDTNEGPDVNSMHWVNTMRDSFTCNPRFSGLLLAGDFTHPLFFVKTVQLLSV